MWQKLGWPIPITEEAFRESWQNDAAMMMLQQQQRTTTTTTGNEVSNIGRADGALVNPPITCGGDQASVIADNSMADVLDNFLNTDPMDLLDWRDWESASEGFFAA